MKIIGNKGNKKDYWWWAALKDGIDEKVIYNATSLTPFSDDGDCYVKFHEDAAYCDCDYDGYWEVDCRVIEIGFMRYIFNPILNGGFKPVDYEIEVVRINPHEKENNYPINTWLQIHNYNNDKEDFCVLTNISLVNSTLAKKFIPAEEVARYVCEYLSWCNDNSCEIKEPDNNTKIINAGFDLKTSFRKEKKKKK